jgi:hypothetical protein
VTIREIEQGQRMDYAYHIKMRRGVACGELMQALKLIPQVQQVNIMMQEATLDL